VEVDVEVEVGFWREVLEELGGRSCWKSMGGRRCWRRYRDLYNGGGEGGVGGSVIPVIV